MRSFLAVFMFLIGMISFTAMASTPLQDKNQNATFESPEKTFAYEANVQMNFGVNLFNVPSVDFIYILERLKLPDVPVVHFKVIEPESKFSYSAKEPPNSNCSSNARLFKSKILIRNNC